MPGHTKCNIVVIVVNLLCSMTSLSLSKFRMRWKLPSDFSRTNMDKINSLGACFVPTITDLANKVFISAVINSCSFLLNGYWYNFTAGRFSVISICVPDAVVRNSGSNVSSSYCFRWNLGVSPWNGLILFWRYFLTRWKFFTCNVFWKEISVSFISSWSFCGRYLSSYYCADCSCFSSYCSSFLWFSFFKDSRESLIESPKRWSDEWSAMSANLAYWTANDGLIRFLLS